MKIIPLFAALALAGCATTYGFPGEDVAATINAQVNSKVDYHYKDQPQNYTPTEVMKPGGSGNCADFAVLKCAMLAKNGFSPSRLSLVKFMRWDGVGHAVCVVDGKYALDWATYPVEATPAGLGVKHGRNIVAYTPAVNWKGQ